MIVKIDNLAAGAIPDAPAAELPLGAWSYVRNMVFRGGCLERAPGASRLFDAPSVVPYFIAPFRTATDLFWIHAGLQRVYVDNGTARTEVTPASVYTGGASDRWTGGSFNGQFILNNGVEVPQFWNGNTGTDFANLTNWPAGYTCKALRPFRNVLVAMDITNSGTRYPWRVRWSAIADPGSVPPSWDIADATREAGEVDLDGAAGPIVDGLQLGDHFAIYTGTSAHLMRYVGGQQLFAFSRAGSFGMLAQHCAAATPLGHVVLTAGDVVLFDGQQHRSIATDRVRRAIFDAMNSETAERACFVVANPQATEVWVCYPTAGSTCEMAAVWNWTTDTWGFRALRQMTAAACGQVPKWSATTWANVTGTWADAVGAWGGGEAAPNDVRLVLASATPALSLVGGSAQDDGVSFTATAQRAGLHFGEPGRIKQLRAIWPKVDATSGTALQIRVGAADFPDTDPTWQSAQTFTVGTDRKLDCRCSGRYLALEISVAADAECRMRSADLDVVLTGTR